MGEVIPSFEEFMGEGTWAIPNSFEERKYEGYVFISKIEDLKNEIYPIFGDDTLLDCLDNAIKRMEELIGTMPYSGDKVDEGLNEDIMIPPTLSTRYMTVKKQIADKQSQIDLLAKQIEQKKTEMTTLQKNLNAIETEAAKQTGETVKEEPKPTTTEKPSSEPATSTPTKESIDLDIEFPRLIENFETPDILILEEFDEVLDPEDHEEGIEESPIEELDPDSVFAVRINDEIVDEEIIAKFYRNQEDEYWKCRVVKGSEEPLEKMKFDPKMQMVDIIENLATIYDEVEEIDMSEYEDLIDDKEEQDSKFDYEEE